jgi:dTDP-glucose pyrophosphorylase
MLRALIPMAGEGSRFKQAGYTFPKPLIDVNGKPMIQIVIETLPECNEYIFLCRKEHLEQYKLDSMLQSMTNNKAKIVVVDKLTEGAACTALLAKNLINDDHELLIANSDQYIEYNKINFDILRDWSPSDGIIFTFNATHPKWSFVKYDPYYSIVQVAEKNPISNIATCGIYWWRHGSEFIRAAENMIKRNIRVNNEFYIAPTFNEMIGYDTTILPFFVDKMRGLGTPEDLEVFLNETH